MKLQYLHNAPRHLYVGGRQMGAVEQIPDRMTFSSIKQNRDLLET